MGLLSSFGTVALANQSGWQAEWPLFWNRAILLLGIKVVASGIFQYFEVVINEETAASTDDDVILLSIVHITPSRFPLYESGEEANRIRRLMRPIWQVERRRTYIGGTHRRRRHILMHGAKNRERKEEGLYFLSPKARKDDRGRERERGSQIECHFPPLTSSFSIDSRTFSSEFWHGGKLGRLWKWFLLLSFTSFIKAISYLFTHGCLYWSTVEPSPHKSMIFGAHFRTKRRASFLHLLQCCRRMENAPEEGKDGRSLLSLSSWTNLESRAIWALEWNEDRPGLRRKMFFDREEDRTKVKILRKKRVDLGGQLKNPDRLSAHLNERNLRSFTQMEKRDWLWKRRTTTAF